MGSAPSAMGASRARSAGSAASARMRGRVAFPSTRSAPSRLPELGRVRGVVERVVDELEGGSDALAEPSERRRDVAVGARRPAARRAGPAEERRGLALDDLEVVALGGPEAAAERELLHLALDQPAHGGEQGGEGARRRGVSGDDLEGSGEQPVAGQDRDRVPPDDAGGGLAAAQRPVVDDVVVKEGGGVGQLGGDAEGHGRGHVAPARAAGEQRHGGADALPAGGHQVAGGGPERGLGVGGGARELALQRGQLVEEARDLGERGLCLGRPGAVRGGLLQLLADLPLLGHRRRI